MRNSTGATDQIQQELATTLSSRTFDDSREVLVGTDEPITHQETEGGKRAQGVDLEGNRQNKLRHDDKPEGWRPDCNAVPKLEAGGDRSISRKGTPVTDLTSRRTVKPIHMPVPNSDTSTREVLSHASIYHQPPSPFVGENIAHANYNADRKWGQREPDGPKVRETIHTDIEREERGEGSRSSISSDSSSDSKYSISNVGREEMREREKERERGSSISSGKRSISNDSERNVVRGESRERGRDKSSGSTAEREEDKGRGRSSNSEERGRGRRGSGNGRGKERSGSSEGRSRGRFSTRGGSGRGLGRGLGTGLGRGGLGRGIGRGNRGMMRTDNMGPQGQYRYLIEQHSEYLERERI